MKFKDNKFVFLITWIFLISSIIVAHVGANEMNGIYASYAKFGLEINGKPKDIKNDILVVDGTTYVPLREMSNILDCSVKWEEDNKLISITSDFQYLDRLSRFKDENNNYGFKNEDGNIIIPPQYFLAMDFKEGMSIVQSADDNYAISFINQQGNKVAQFPVNYYQAESGFSDGVTVLYYNTDTEHRSADGEKKYIYVDKAGNRVIEQEFVYARNFSEGYAVVAESEGMWKDSWKRIYRYIDKTGEYVSEKRFSDAESFKDGFAKVKTIDGQSGKIDRSFVFYPDNE